MIITPAGAAPTARFYILLTWRSDLGAAVEPVGVLGVGLGPVVTRAMAWAPCTWDAARGWQDRLGATTDAELLTQIEHWLDTPGTEDLLRVDGPPGCDLATSVEVLLDEVLAGAVAWLNG